MAKLGDVATYINGYPFKPSDWSDEGMPIIRIQDLTGNSYQANRYNGDLPVKYKVIDGDVLISWSASLGVYVWKGETAVLNQHIFKVVFDKCKIDKSFFVHQVQCILEKALSEVHGATMKHLTKPVFDSLLFYLPPIEEQRHIAAVLDKVCGLIKIRNKQIKKLDLLVKSQFIEMFGNTFSNSKGWPVISIKKSSLLLSDGPFGSNLKSEHYSESGVQVIRLGNIGVGEFIDKDKAFIPFEHYERLKKYTCKPGDIVIGTLGDPNLRACIIPESLPISINKADCVHFIPDPTLLNSTFACQYLNCPETLLLASGMIHGQTRSRVSSGQIAQMNIYLPPLELQNQFAVLKEQADKSKFEIQKSLEKLETMKKSLMQQYFG